MNQQSFDFNSPIVYQLLKKNAPAVFNSWIHKKLYELNGQLQSLRYQYKYADDSEKDEIKRQGEAVKQKIEQLQKEIEPPKLNTP